MKMNKISGLARPVDISYRSNRHFLLVGLLTLLVASGYQLFMGNAFLESLWWGIQAAFVTFLSWAIGRELDPDINSSALLSIPLSLAAFYFFEDLNWLLLFVFVMMMRVGSHICGQSVKITDAVLVIGLATYVVWRGEYVVGFALAITFLADSQLRPPHQKSIWYALAALLLSIAALIISPATTDDFSYQPYWPWGVVGVALLFALVVIRDYKRPRSTEDYRVQALSGSRMQAVQLIVMISVVVMYFLKGQLATLAVAPVWAGILSATLIRFYQGLTGRSLS